MKLTTGTLFFLLLSIPSWLVGQQAKINVTSNPNQVASDLVNIFVGEGVTVSNAVIGGNTSQLGTFQDITNTLGLDTGIILSSGYVTDAIGPNNATNTGTKLNGSGHSLIDAMVNDPSYDAARLEFDFIAETDNISFKYIFASEEYPEFVCESYNDAFGLFISGPNPAGGSYINTNVALIPNSTTPVTIDNVNMGCNSGFNTDCCGASPPSTCSSCIFTNTAFYVDNYTTASAAYSTVQYDGFTTPMKATLSLVPNTTYHIVIVIADVKDYIYDSGIFLEAGSFSSCEPVSFNIKSPLNLCLGTPSTFILGNNINELIDVSWDFGNGSNSNAFMPTVSYLSEGSYPVTVTAKPAINCTANSYQFLVNVDNFDFCTSCTECIGSFAPEAGKKYVLSAWVKESEYLSKTTYEDGGIEFLYEGVNLSSSTFKASGPIIEGWQQIEEEFTIPEGTSAINIQLKNEGASNVFFDDIRIFPFNANLKSFVYDPITMRLTAELDENNYATFYEYDEDGNLVRIKKETDRGVKTIQESIKRYKQQ